MVIQLFSGLLLLAAYLAIFFALKAGITAEFAQPRRWAEIDTFYLGSLLFLGFLLGGMILEGFGIFPPPLVFLKEPPWIGIWVIFASMAFADVIAIASLGLIKW